MPTAFHSSDADDLSQTERDVRAALGDMAVDFDALAVISNVNRVARAVRNDIEQSVLAPHQLSWTAFAILFELFVWGDCEASRLADSVGVTRGTLTGVVNTLATRRLLARKSRTEDKRIVIVSLTERGRALVRDVFPEFNTQEAEAVSALSRSEQAQLASSLRAVQRRLDATGSAGQS